MNAAHDPVNHTLRIARLEEKVEKMRQLMSISTPTTPVISSDKAPVPSACPEQVTSMAIALYAEYCKMPWDQAARLIADFGPDAVWFGLARAALDHIPYLNPGC